jgi:phosphate-selective porin OprO and OprP
MSAASRRWRSGIAVWILALGVPAGVQAQPVPHAVLACPVVVPAPEAAPSTDADLEQRVRDLETAIEQLKTQDAAQPWQGSLGSPIGSRDSSSFPPVPRGTQGLPLDSGMLLRQPAAETASAGNGLAGWSNGFFLRSADNAYVLRFTGQIQADLRDFLDDRDQKDISTFLVRRARLGIDAIVFENFEFRLLPDFGQSQPVIEDAYLNIHYVDAMQFAFGKLKQPVSYEQLIQDRFVPTAERSIIDQLVPARDVGVLVHGYNLLGDKLDYAFGVYNGEINGNLDTNGFKDLAWRVALRPLNFEALPEALHYLQIGISGTTGDEKEPINPNVLHTPATVQFFAYNSTVQANGLRNRWAPELSYFYGPFGFAAQYYYETQEMSPSTVLENKVHVNVPFYGGYVMATCLLTGENRTDYSEILVPLHPFDPLHPLTSPGAWELVARWSRLDVGSVVFAPGVDRLANPLGNADRAQELTLGYNWYLNGWVRMQFNIEHAWFNSPVQLGPGIGNRLTNQNTLIARFQVIF